MNVPPPRYFVYAIAVSLAGLTLVVTAVAVAGPASLPVEEPSFWLLAVGVILAELLPINVYLRTGTYSLAASSCFSFALLLSAGLPAAILAQAVGSLASDVRFARPPWKRAVAVAGFSAGQYVLALGAAAAVLALLADVPNTSSALPFSPGDLPSIVLAGGVFFSLNTLLVGIMMALENGVQAAKSHLADLDLHAYNLGLLGLSPIVVLSVDFGPLFLLLLVESVIVSQYSMRAAVRNQHRALHDPLTDLPNRVLFADRVQSAIQAAARRGVMAAIMVMDLDGFKQVNDAYGHRRGDMLLRQVGLIASLRLRRSDTLARLGGDEFGILLPEVESREAAVDVAFEIRRALALTMAETAGALAIQASIGIACIPDHGREVDGLLDAADAAMYRAKQLESGVAVSGPAEGEARAAERTPRAAAR